MSLSYTAGSTSPAAASYPAPTCDTLWWRGSEDGPIHTGWVVDRCSTGVAFMFKGEEPPAVGAMVNAAHADPRDPLSTPYRAVVSRVVRLHAGMHLVAATFAPSRAAAA